MNPRTKASLKKILYHARHGLLGALGSGGCVYHNTKGQFCAIGCLLSPDLHQILDEKNWNENFDAFDLFDWMHKNGMNPYHKYGLSAIQARALQAWHDACYIPDSRLFTPTDFADIVEALIDGSITCISTNPNGLTSSTCFD